MQFLPMSSAVFQVSIINLFKRIFLGILTASNHCFLQPKGLRVLKLFFFISALMMTTDLASQVRTLVQPGFQWHEPTAWSPIGVPTASDSVIIGGPTFIMPDSLGRAKFVFIHPSGSLDIQRDVPNSKRGRLLIRNSPQDGMINEGELIVGGRLTIRNAGLTALWNSGQITVQDSAKILIDSTTNGNGIYNNGYFESDGNIEIVKVSDDGFRNIDTVWLQSNSELILDGTGTSTVSSNGFANGNNTSFMNNVGTISIKGFQFYGVLNFGDMFNHDTITVDSNVGGGLINYNSSSFNNMGVFQLKNVGHPGIRNLGILINQDNAECNVDLTLGNGFENVGLFSNSGNLVLSSTQDTAIIHTGSSFSNNVTGVITIDSTDLFDDGPGIYNMKTFENEGFCQILKTDGQGIVNLDSFFNRQGGTLQIMHQPYDGILNEVDAYFENSGSAVIGSAGMDSGINNNGTIKNNGVLDLNTFSDDGITNYGILENDINGLIDIRFSEDYAIEIKTGGAFENRGRVSIDSAIYGIYLRGPLTNYDTISFGVMDDYCFENFDTLMNMASGVIIGIDSDETLVYSQEYVHNYGMILGYGENRGITNGDHFINEGTIYFQSSGLFSNGISNSTNGNFENMGLIKIDTSGSDGIENEGLFTNSDTIVIAQYQEYGLDNEGQFINQPGASITILNTESNEGGLINRSGVDHSFDNHGFISIDGGGNYGLLINAEFVNSASGVLQIANTLGVPFESDIGTLFECIGILDIQ